MTSSESFSENKVPAPKRFRVNKFSELIEFQD